MSKKKDAKNNKAANVLVLLGVSCLVIAVLVIALNILYKHYIAPAFYYATEQNVIKTEEFPTIDEEELTDKQKSIIASAKRVWTEPRPESFYTDVPRNEPWCANFVSYIYREAGLPFTNPVAGGWRIPGIYTLRDYLENEGYWHAYDSDYVPVTGDIVIYDGGVMSGHTNIILKNEDGIFTTLGGNENNAIHIQQFDSRDKKYGIRGYGHIE